MDVDPLRGVCVFTRLSGTPLPEADRKWMFSIFVWLTHPKEIEAIVVGIPRAFAALFQEENDGE